MRNRLRLFVLIGGAGVVLGAAALVACSDDTSVQPNGDGGTPEGSTTDSPTGDGGENDTGTDAPFDGGFQVSTFDTVLATEMCKTLARCCFGSAAPADGGADGGTFDTDMCVQDFGRLGFENSNVGAELKDGGNVVLDQVAADSCIKKIQALSCNLPGPEFKAVRAACFSAYSGSLATGAACKDSIECQKTAFCLGVENGDGGCQPLRPTNGACGDFTTNPKFGEQACSYRAGGGTGNYCSFLSDVPTGTFKDAGDWKCTPAGGVGTDCASNRWCDNSICNFDTTKCETPNRYLDGVCTTYVFP